MFVDTAPVMEKPLAAGGRPRLAGQAHQPGLARVRLVAVPRRDLHHARAAARRAGATIIAAPAAPASTSARPRLPGALSARCAALHLLSHHRAQGPDPARAPPAMGNRIYGCDDCLAVCPWNKFAQRRPRGEACGARTRCARRSSPNWRGSTMPAFRALFAKSAGQAHRPRPLSSATC